MCIKEFWNKKKSKDKEEIKLYRKYIELVYQSVNYTDNNLVTLQL